VILLTDDQQLAVLKQEIQALGEKSGTFPEDDDKSFEKLMSLRLTRLQGNPLRRQGRWHLSTLICHLPGKAVAR